MAAGADCTNEQASADDPLAATGSKNALPDFPAGRSN